MRKAEIKRTTAETDIFLSLDLDGSGKSNIASGVGFLDHMLTLFAKHARIDIDITCKGDTYVDDHHSVEDIGIALGEAFDKAIGDKRGICRYGNFCLPMDETLVLCALDFSGRGFLSYDLSSLAQKVGNFDTELVEEFFRAFASNAKLTFHIKKLDGTNTHHIIEAAFKACGRAVRQAKAFDAEFIDDIPSTKGVL